VNSFKAVERGKTWTANENGATSIEYAMIAFFISILIVAGAAQIGTTVHGFFASVIAAV
jgi:Flp pilus assembly pilin Flp